MSRFDCVIVGSGIIGSSIAFYLARAGKKVALVEKSEFGKEASFAAGGILTPVNITEYPPELASRCVAAGRSYRSYLDDLKAFSDIDPEYIKSGSIFLIKDSEDETWVRKLEETSQRLNVKCHRLDQGELRKIEPNVSHEMEGALFMPDIYQVRNNRLMKLLEEALKKLQVDVFTNTAASEVSRSEVRTGGKTFQAENVLVAAGAWSGQLVRVQVKPIKGQMLVADAPQMLKAVIYHKGQYLVPRADGKVLIGSTMEDVGFDKTITVEAMNRLTGVAISIVPEIRKYPIVKSWAGLRPAGTSRLPTETRVDGVMVATGHYRNGILLAPLAASAIVTELTGKRIFE